MAETHVNIPHCAQTGSCPAGIVNRRHSDVIYPPVKRSNWDPPLNAGQWLLLSTHGLRFAATKLFKLALGWRSIVLTSVLRTLYRPVIAGNWLEPCSESVFLVNAMEIRICNKKSESFSHHLQFYIFYKNHFPD
jgi:hypothetical protein